MDGDGDLDVLLGNDGSSRVLLYVGSGTFPTSIELPGGSAYTSSADVDVDGDSDLDVLHRGRRSIASSIVYSIAAADVDGDGDLDVLLGAAGSPSRVQLLNAGESTELPGGGASTNSIAATDVDCDERPRPLMVHPLRSPSKYQHLIWCVRNTWRNKKRVNRPRAYQTLALTSPLGRCAAPGNGSMKHTQMGGISPPARYLECTAPV